MDRGSRNLVDPEAVSMRSVGPLGVPAPAGRFFHSPSVSN